MCYVISNLGDGLEPERGVEAREVEQRRWVRDRVREGLRRPDASPEATTAAPAAAPAAPERPENPEPERVEVLVARRELARDLLGRCRRRAAQRPPLTVTVDATCSAVAAAPHNDHR